MGGNLFHACRSDELEEKSDGKRIPKRTAYRKYEGVKLEADFTNPKWIERHRHMFHFLDPNNNNAVSLDELIYKASEEICKKIGATPEQTERHSQAVENFFSAAGLKHGEETEWDEYIKGWE